MSNLDSLIRNNLDMPISEDVSIYKDVENRKKFTNEICEIVNTKINKTVQPYDKDILEDIRTNGYAVVENFISSDEIEELETQEVENIQEENTIWIFRGSDWIDTSTAEMLTGYYPTEREHKYSQRIKFKDA